MVGKVNLLLEKTGWGFRKQKCLYQHAADLNPSCFLFVFVLRYKPALEDQIMKAFEVLDQENKGYLTTEELTKYMSEEGRNYFYLLLPSLSFLFLRLGCGRLSSQHGKCLELSFFLFFLFTTFFLYMGASLRDTQPVSAHSLH